VSVIVPAYNAAAHLPRCLDSIAAQTYADWEAIVVDDGSADDTAAVAERDDPRLRLVRSPTNVGLASARNLGIESARGELLALLDADDAWRPEYLERMVALYDAAPGRVGLVTCNARFVEGGVESADTYLDRFPRPERVGVDELLEGNCVFISVLAPRAVVDEAGGFAAGMRSAEDHDLWLRIAEAGYEIVATGEPLVLYTLAPGQLSANLAGMAAGGEEVYRRALERGRLTRAQRRRAARQLRLMQAASLAAARRRPRLAELPLVARVVAENPSHWTGWLKRAR
jgi:glycosyltransferase involved in cell wall biosynthesis